MSFADVPTDVVSVEDSTEPVQNLQLEEGQDAEQESLELSGLSAYVRGVFEDTKTRRVPDETRWLQGWRNFRGHYSEETKFTSKEKSRAFVKVTKTKVLAAYAQIMDVMMAGGKFPISVVSPNNPVGVAESVSYDPQALTPEKVKERTGKEIEIPRRYLRPDIEKDLGVLKDKLAPVHEELEEGTGDSPTAAVFNPAEATAREMDDKIQDQLSETDAEKHLRLAAFEAALFGHCVMKGPFSFNKEYPKWDKEGKYTPEFQRIPKIEAFSIWDYYPDPDARHKGESQHEIQRHRMNRTQMRGLARRPGFRKESIELAIDDGPNYVPEYWEHTLEDNTIDGPTSRWEVLDFWGVVDSDMAEDAGLELPEAAKDAKEIQINVWVCGGHILRLVVNPFTPARIPFYDCPYELNPYSRFGIGVAENMSDTQLLMNGFMRLAVDNAALSGNLMIEVDETNLIPGQSMDVFPGKIWRRQAGAPGQAIFGTKFPNVSNEMLLMFDKARQLSDEATGMPSYAHGMSGVMSTGRTASGMSMLMGAAATNIKAVVANFDDYLLAPLGKALFAFNMQFNFEERFTQGPLEVVAKGTESLMRNEIRSQRLLQLTQIASNQMMAPLVKWDRVLAELAASMDLDEEQLVNDPREALIQAKMMADIQRVMGPPPGASQGAPGGPGVPGPQDPTGTGGGNIAPGQSPEPGAAGFTGNTQSQPQAAAA